MPCLKRQKQKGIEKVKETGPLRKQILKYFTLCIMIKECNGKDLLREVTCLPLQNG